MYYQFILSFCELAREDGHLILQSEKNMGALVRIQLEFILWCNSNDAIVDSSVLATLSQSLNSLGGIPVMESQLTQIPLFHFFHKDTSI